MNQNRVAVVPHVLTSLPSRRDVLRGLVAAGLGLGALRLPGAAAKKTKRKKARQPKPNAFGCLRIGDPCKTAGQCCSGICQSRKGRRRCIAHDTGGCRPGQQSGGCGGTAGDIPCTSSSGAVGKCYTTTGGAGYCGTGDCYPCTKDVDCQAVCGPRAACIACAAECQTGTACRGPDGEVCPL